MSSSSIEDISSEELVGFIEEHLTPDLNALEPEEAIERYLRHIEPDRAKSTLNSYRRKLARFADWCRIEGIVDLRELDGEKIDRYQLWLRDHSSSRVEQLSRATMRDECYLLKGFLEYLEKIDGVKPSLSEDVSIPRLRPGEGVRDVDLAPERLQQSLAHLEKFHYGTLDHVTWVLLKKGRRTGGVRAPDLPDCHLDSDTPYIDIVHRPPNTPLKNGEKSECKLELTKEEADVIRDFIENRRPAVEDPPGREALLATQFGRASSGTIRKIVYRHSRPCAVSQPCPEGRDPDDCKAAQNGDDASKCPASRSPHALKHGFISEARRKGVPVELISERCDVSIEVLLEVYDESTEAEKSELRREIFSSYAEDNGGGYL